MPTWRAAAIGICALAATSGAFAEEAPYYKGRRITALISFAAGGPADIDGRLLVKHLSRHIEGQPAITVQNMEGAGGIVGAKYVGEVGPNDGTLMGLLTGAAFMYAFDPGRFRADFRTYEFVATQAGTSVHYARTDVPPGLKHATDIVKARGLVVGGLSVDTPKDLRMRLALDMLGVQYRYVPGYRSSQPARLAFQRGEISMFSESPPSYRGVVEPSLVAKGEAIPLFYDANYEGGAYATPKQMEGLTVLPFHELHRSIKGAIPSGPMWDVYRSITNTEGGMQRMIVLPPATPPAAVAALRRAIRSLNHDKAYAEEATKAFGFVPEWDAEDATNERARAALVMRPQVRAFLVDYMKAASK